RRVGDPLSIRREVEASLRRLDVERIDLYQMHWPAEDGTLLEDYWGTLLQLKEEGKVHAVGLSNHDFAQLEAAERLGHVDTLQPPFSAIRREVAVAELPWCAAHRTGVIVYSPMQSGLLTGAFSVTRATQLGADDWRSRSPDFTGQGLRRNLALADALRPIAERHGATVAAVAVAWTLAWPGVSGAIVGARSPAQVDGWIDAASLDLTDATLHDVAALRRVALGAYLPSLSLISSAAWSDQTTLGTAGVTPGLSPAGGMNTYGAGFAAALDVFTGGRRGAQRSYAEAITQAADAGLVQQQYATMLVAKQGYYEVVRAHELVRVALESVAQAELGLGYARDRLAAGTATRADVLLSQLAVSTARRRALAARDTLSTAGATLGRLVGANEPVEAEPLPALEPAPLALGDSGVLAAAPAAAPAVAQAQALASAGAAGVRASKSQYLPTIAVGAGYNWANESRVPGALRSGWVVAFTTSFPLFNGFVREASVTQAEAAAELATATSADTKRLARAEAQRLLG